MFGWMTYHWLYFLCDGTHQVLCLWPSVLIQPFLLCRLSEPQSCFLASTAKYLNLVFVVTSSCILNTGIASLLRVLICQIFFLIYVSRNCVHNFSHMLIRPVITPNFKQTTRAAALRTLSSSVWFSLNAPGCCQLMHANSKNLLQQNPHFITGNSGRLTSFTLQLGPNIVCIVWQKIPLWFVNKDSCGMILDNCIF